MKTIIILTGLLLSINLFSQIQIIDKYLIPKNDTMDVIKIEFVDIEKFTMDVGKFSRIEPVVVDTLLPKGDYFLPKRCLYDADMKSIRNLLNAESKQYLKISTKKLIPKAVIIER